MFIGRQDIYTLETWIQGYVSACIDAGEENRLNTPEGIPISILRDYLAWKEQDYSTGGIAYIMMEAANGSHEEALKRFFSYLDEFESLVIVSTWRMTITESMAKHTANQKQVFTINESGNWRHLSFQGFEFSKTVLNNGLCWIKTKSPHESSGRFGFVGSGRSVMLEKEADKQMAEWFGVVRWEPGS